MSTFKEIPAYQLETLYRIMLRRISKGYSAAQLAFLIGVPDYFVSDVETLERPFYSADELERIAIALEEKNPSCFSSALNDESILQVIVYGNHDDGRFVNAYYRVGEDDTQTELFRLQEEVFPEADHAQEILEILIDTIDVLIRTGYFYEPKLPFEVFSAVNSLWPEPVNPVFVQKALQSFMVSEGNEVRLRMAGQIGEVYRYEEC